MSKNKNQEYNEDSIKEYKYPENVQKKPSMYIGDIGIEGCTHMVREVIDNSVDEALNGFGTTIVIKISNDKGYVSVEDYGRGIPPKAIEKAFCTLHASGKFDNNEYSASAGTNGVGTTAVNALSKSFIVESVRDNKAYVQKFSNGIAITKLKETGTKKKKSGTIVYFEPNPDFMQEVKFDIDTIKEELSTKIYALKGIKIMLVNEDTKEKFTMLSENGLSDYVKKYTKEPICSPIKISKEVEFTRPASKGLGTKTEQKLKFSFDMEFSYDRKSHTDIISFCNSLLMREGGIQETTFKTALTRFFKSYIEQNKILSKKDEKLLEKINGDHVTDGLVGIISIKHPDPIFQNQTKQKLKSTEVGQISKYITEALEDFATNNPKEIKNICQKIIVSVKAYEAAKNARETVQKKGENQFAIVSDLSKLANCISKDINENELFITEGRSASGTAKEARDKILQAIYSLRGKMLNTLGLPAAKVLANKECADLVYITTGEKNAIRENFSIDMLKYGKIIMLCDADVDGFAIVILGAVFYFENMRPVIEEGHFYVAIPPLYSIVEKGGKKRYFVDQDDYDEYIFEKVLEKYTFINSSKKKISTVSKIKSIFKKYEILNDFINNIVKSNTGLDSQLLIDFLNVAVEEDIDTATFVGDYTEDISYNKKTKVYDGFYNGNYVSFTDDSIWEALGAIDEFIEENKIPLTDIYYLNEDKEYTRFTIDDYRRIIKEVTPSSRCRMKGLGEMDPDELRDTTLDKEKRNIYRITVEDVEKAIDCLNNYMNGSSKFADIRKDILLRKQDEIAKLNLI